MSGFVQRVLIRLVMESSFLSLCQNIGTLPKIHTHSLSQASHGELCVNNHVRIRFHYFRSCVIINSTMQQNNDIVSVSKVFAIFWNVLKQVYVHPKINCEILNYQLLRSNLEIKLFCRFCTGLATHNSLLLYSSMYCEVLYYI